MMNYQRKQNMYMYLFWAKMWVDNNLALVLFKHHCHNRFLHKVTYVKEICKLQNDFSKQSETKLKAYI